MTEIPKKRPFVEVAKKSLIGNALKLGLENYLKAVIEELRYKIS